jgi:hypothetical protein
MSPIWVNFWEFFLSNVTKNSGNCLFFLLYKCHNIKVCLFNLADHNFSLFNKSLDTFHYSQKSKRMSYLDFVLCSMNRPQDLGHKTEIPVATTHGYEEHMLCITKCSWSCYGLQSLRQIIDCYVAGKLLIFFPSERNQEKAGIGWSIRRAWAGIGGIKSFAVRMFHRNLKTRSIIKPWKVKKKGGKVPKV